ncbi:pyridine nucleotide-disulfide oxidoreductase [Caldanaerobacter subterraneus]|nr:pyridine nucleotide-disulfide oxidoreductase [Caldanaerobacter subterraneus]
METDVLVIGGSAGGILAALSVKKTYKDKKVTVIRMAERVMVPCGIPYIFGTLKDTSKNVIPDSMLTNAGVELVIDEVVSIDRPNKKVSTRKNGDISYKKLILATGSLPIVPTFIPGYDLDNVFTIKKDEEYLKFVQQKINEAEDVVVVGGGFIGVEMAE